MSKTYFTISPSCDMAGPFNTIELAIVAAKELVKDDEQTCYVVKIEKSVCPGEPKLINGYLGE